MFIWSVGPLQLLLKYVPLDPKPAVPLNAKASDLQTPQPRKPRPQAFGVQARLGRQGVRIVRRRGI